MNTIDEIIECFMQVVNGSFLPIRNHKYKSYAITNFRGGIGKSTLSFNLAHEFSMKNTLLTIDTCSQRNFS
jgi:chromosome partitioning protein